MKKKKWLIIGVVVLVVVVLGIVSLTSNGGETIKATSVLVEQQNLKEKVSASGRIQPQTKVDITSEINGEIIDLRVVEGQRVAVGDLLVVLDTVQIKADVQQARYALDESNARLEGAKAMLEQNQEEFDRQQQMFDRGLTSETIYRDARYAFLSAKSTHESSEASSRRLQAAYDKELDRLEKARITAPMAGVITFLDCEVGEIAAAQTSFTQGKVLMTLSDLSVFEVEVEVDETEINKIALGQTAGIEVDAFPDTVFAGVITEIGNTAVMVGAGTQDQSTNFNVKVQFKEGGVDLRPGMSADVDIETAVRDDIMAVPFSSIVMRNYDLDSLQKARESGASGSEAVAGVQAAENAESDTTKKAGSEDDEERKDIKGVFVIRDGLARFVSVETGVAGKKNIEITTGLAVGDTVISGPYRVLRTLKDGDKVEAEMESEKKIERNVND